MTIDTSIGLDDPREDADSNPVSGIDDEARERKAREDGESVMNDDAGHIVTREDIEADNDRNVSADDGGRSGTTNRIRDDSIDIGE